MTAVHYQTMKTYKPLLTQQRASLLPVQSLCTRGTKPLYSQYKGSSPAAGSLFDNALRITHIAKMII